MSRTTTPLEQGYSQSITMLDQRLAFDLTTGRTAQQLATIVASIPSPSDASGD